MRPRFVVTRAVLAAASMALAASASAESTASGAGPAASRLNLRVVVPYYIYFAVGPGAGGGPRTPNPTITTITYSFAGAANTVGNGTASANVVVPVRISCNGGPTTISISHPPNLTSGTDTIPFTQIEATSQDPTTFPVPVMGGGAVNVPTSGTSRITNRNSNWSYRYRNTVKPAPGTYTGQVTYTAALL